MRKQRFTAVQKMAAEKKINIDGPVPGSSDPLPHPRSGTLTRTHTPHGQPHPPPHSQSHIHQLPHSLSHSLSHMPVPPSRSSVCMLL